MPGRTGPRTEKGKRRSSLNRLSHGLRVNGPLPCRKDACFYRSQCRVSEKQPERWAALEYGSPCATEADLVAAWRASDTGPGKFSKDSPVEMKQLENIIVSSLLRDRATRALHIEGDGDNRLVCYYYNRSSAKRRSAYAAAMPLLRGMIVIQQYVSRIMEDSRKHTQQR